MDNPQQPKGNLYASLYRYKVQGDGKPIFVGTLTKPGENAELPFSLWTFKFIDKKTGEIKIGYSGGINGVPANIPAAEQIEALLSDPSGVDVTIANLTLRPGQIVLFPNGFKDEAPEKGRPDHWGWVNPTDGTAPFKSGVWIKQFEDSKRPYLSGVTQYPLPKRPEADQQPTLEDLVASEKVTRGMPTGRKRREGRE